MKPYTAIAQEALQRRNASIAERKKTDRRVEQSLHFTAVDCATYPNECSNAEVKSYPTLIAYKDGVALGK